MGGATWAKGNVYKSGSNFYFESSQSGYHSGTQGGSFFGWNTLSSTNNTYGGSSFSSDNDPCDKVAPQHTWCTPTANQLLKFREIVDIGLDIWMVRGEDILAVIRFFCPQWETEVRIM